jgi:hypothetical protein
VDRGDEVEARGVGAEVLEAVALADRGEVAGGMPGFWREPGIVVALEVPEVVVGVDDLPGLPPQVKTWWAVRVRSMRSQS